MAVCKFCGQEMKTADGCSVVSVFDGDAFIRRIPVGGKGDFLEGADSSQRCHDCNATFGHMHHVGCDSERCPKCGGQLITCGCFSEGSFKVEF